MDRSQTHKKLLGCTWGALITFIASHTKYLTTYVIPLYRMEPEFFTAVHATWLSGHGAVILNPDWTDFEIRNVVVQGNVGLILHAFFTPSADFADITRFRTSDLYGTEGSSETQESLRSFNDTDSLSNVTDAELRGNLVEVGDDFLVSAVIVEALETVFSDFEASDQSVSTHSMPIYGIIKLTRSPSSSGSF